MPRRSQTGFWDWMVRRAIPLQYETLLFILVSVLDIAMTWRLVQIDYRVREGNPLANYVWMHWGIRGVVYFKMAMVAFIVLVCQVIATRRPELARWVLRLAIAVAAFVVIYGLALVLRVRGVL